MNVIKSTAIGILFFSIASCSVTGQDIVKESDAVHHSRKSVLTSVQLWGVRKDLRKDLRGTLEKLAAMRFDGVEFAKDFGPYKNDPQGLRDYLDSIGLRASGAHLNFKPFRNEFHKTVAFYKTLGVDTIIIPKDKRSFNPEKFDEFTNELNQLAKRLAKYGLKTGYHNHWQEFGIYKRATYWDYIGCDTSEDVVLQLDIVWVNYSEQDSIAFIERFPGRTLTTHIKPKFAKSYETYAEANGHYAIIGSDNFNWLAVFDAMLKTGGTKQFVIEQEEYPLGLFALDAAEASKTGFDDIVSTVVKKG